MSQVNDAWAEAMHETADEVRAALEVGLEAITLDELTLAAEALAKGSAALDAMAAVAWEAAGRPTPGRR